MSDPDKSGSGAEGSAVVLVDQTATSRHKQPFRSCELQEETADLHHKRSKAPAVPSSVVEDFKDNTSLENKDRRLKDNVSSEKSHNHAAKKLSSIKKRDSSPETITLSSMDTESKVGSIAPPTQPIPAQVSEASTLSDISIDKIDSDKKDDDDITDDITELRTPESTNRANWDRSSPDCTLERTASIGPCVFPTSHIGKPSGIAITILKKSSRSIKDFTYDRHSTINICIAKKFPSCKRLMTDEVECNEYQDLKSTTFLASLKEKIFKFGEKVRNFF